MHVCILVRACGLQAINSESESEWIRGCHGHGGRCHSNTWTNADRFNNTKLKNKFQSNFNTNAKVFWLMKLSMNMWLSKWRSFCSGLNVSNGKINVKNLHIRRINNYRYDNIQYALRQTITQYWLLQWNLSVTTTSIIKFITCDLFRNVF